MQTLWQVVVCIGVWTRVAITESQVNPDDRIINLPGLTEQPAFNQYSGYLHVNSVRSFHYWLVESEHLPDEDPLVVWFNGGPGCSSMHGLFTENGPFRVQKGGETLYVNTHRWNKIANMLYIESPAGVGFSYSTDANYNTNDDKVASDNYNAIRSFFDKFPQYKGRKLFVTGESYAGVYIPVLLEKMMNDPSFNLQGAAIGNGDLHGDLREDTKFPYWYYHGMVSSSQWEDLTNACCKNANHTDCQFFPFRNEECQAIVTKITLAITTGRINPYNIYKSCDEPEVKATKSTKIDRLIALAFKQAALPFDDGSVRAEFHALTARMHHDAPCVDASDLSAYLNRPDVQTAIHVRRDLPPWQMCSSLIDPESTYTRIYQDMTPQVKAILKSKSVGVEHEFPVSSLSGKYTKGEIKWSFRLLIFNGDGDSVCNFLADERFVDALNLPEVSPRRPWFYTSDKDGTLQIAGFAHDYENLTFATVKGAGHMVPTDQPASSFEMFQRFLQGIQL